MNYTQQELNQAIKTCIDFKYAKKTIQQKKLSPRIDEVLSRLQNDENTAYKHKYPYILIFKTTSNCNLRCKHCFFAESPETYKMDNDLSETELFEILQYFVEKINITNVSLTGGEFFSAPYAMRFLEYLKSKNILVDILTNGTKITADIAKKLGQILNPDMDSLQISLEGPKDVNDFIRGAGVFDKAISSIQMLVEQKLNVCVAITVNSFNALKIAELYEICRKAKIKRLNIGGMIVCSESQQYLQAKREDVIIGIARAIEAHKNNPDIEIKMKALRVFDFLEYDYGRAYIEKIIPTYDSYISSDISDLDIHCQKRGQQVVLFPTGNISMCYECDTGDMIIGNIKEQSFEEMWEKRYTKSIFGKRILQNTCQKCKYNVLCKAGCLISALRKYGTIDAPPAECKYAERMIKDRVWSIGG